MQERQELRIDKKIIAHKFSFPALRIGSRTGHRRTSLGQAAANRNAPDPGLMPQGLAESFRSGLGTGVDRQGHTGHLRPVDTQVLMLYEPHLAADDNRPYQHGHGYDELHHS